VIPVTGRLPDRNSKTCPIRVRSPEGFSLAAGRAPRREMAPGPTDQATLGAPQEFVRESS
jgi:hypothetical protein